MTHKHLLVPVMFQLELVFFVMDTSTTDISTLSLHDALPISSGSTRSAAPWPAGLAPPRRWCGRSTASRSEEHTSELQSRGHLVCRLLLEKKKRRRSIIEGRRRNESLGRMGQ